MQAAGADHLLALLGTDFFVLGEDLLEAPLELLRRLVELLTDLVDRAHVILTLGLVARVRVAEPLLEGLLDGEVFLFRRVASRHRLLVDRGRPAAVVGTAAEQELHLQVAEHAVVEHARRVQMIGERLVLALLPIGERPLIEQTLEGFERVSVRATELCAHSLEHLAHETVDVRLRRALGGIRPLLEQRIERGTRRGELRADLFELRATRLVELGLELAFDPLVDAGDGAPVAERRNQIGRRVTLVALAHRAEGRLLAQLLATLGLAPQRLLALLVERRQLRLVVIADALDFLVVLLAELA